MSWFFGIISWFNHTKGYGFIKEDKTGLDIFMHRQNFDSSNIRSLNKGQRVKYQKQQTNKGYQATHIIGE